MFQSWRQKLRDVAAALNGGRLDEAGRLLSQGDLRSFAPAQPIAAELARQIIFRAEAELAAGDFHAACEHLRIAVAWGAAASQCAALKAKLIVVALADVETWLAAGAFQLAAEKLAGLHAHGLQHPRCQALQDACKHCLAAETLTTAGKFCEAKLNWEAASLLAPRASAVTARREAATAACQMASELTAQLHRALTQQNWTETLDIANRLLELSPANTLAKEARRRAWAAVELKTHSQRLAIERKPHVPLHTGQQSLPRVLSISAGSADSNAMSPPNNDLRFVLWVDGVGGYLVSTADHVSLGPPMPTASADQIAILADLSRQHATLHRDGESYVLQPGQRVALDGQSTTAPRHLGKDQAITLGESVKLRFRQPHPLSATACLGMQSRHRWQPAVDGVLLMADSLVLGPKPSSHIVCRDWPSELVIYRSGDKLYCRWPGAFEVDGIAVLDKAEITSTSTICHGDFSLTLEPV